MRVSKLNEVFYRVQGTRTELLYLKKDTSVFVPGAQYTPSFKNHLWDGKISYLDLKTGSLPAGLFRIVEKCCKDFEFPLETDEEVRKDLEKDAFPEPEKFAETLGLPFPPRDYQLDQLKPIVENRRGEVSSPTGSGKSLVIYMFVRWALENVPGKIILIVPNVTLVEQMLSDFKSYGWADVDDFLEILYSGKKPTFKKRILLTTYQSIMRKTADFYEDYTVLMNDEAHSVKSAQLMKIAKFCVNARYRVGFTGTIPTEPVDYNNVFGVLGQKIYELKSKNLIEAGVLSDIKVVNLFLDYPDRTRILGSSRDYVNEVKMIEEMPERNQGFAFVLDRLPKGQNTLILVNHIKHLESVEKWLTETYFSRYSVHVIQGETDPIIREGIRKSMEDEKDVVLLATYGTMSTGVNIRRIHNIVFGASSKSHIRVLQSIGRGLRLHESKEKLVLWDVVDDLSRRSAKGRTKLNYMMKHWAERYKLYQEQGFVCLKKTIPIEMLEGSVFDYVSG